MRLADRGVERGDEARPQGGRGVDLRHQLGQLAGILAQALQVVLEGPARSGDLRLRVWAALEALEEEELRHPLRQHAVASGDVDHVQAAGGGEAAGHGVEKIRRGDEVLAQLQHPRRARRRALGRTQRIAKIRPHPAHVLQRLAELGGEAGGLQDREAALELGDVLAQAQLHLDRRHAMPDQHPVDRQTLHLQAQAAAQVDQLTDRHRLVAARTLVAAREAQALRLLARTSVQGGGVLDVDQALVDHDHALVGKLAQTAREGLGGDADARGEHLLGRGQLHRGLAGECQAAAGELDQIIEDALRAGAAGMAPGDVELDLAQPRRHRLQHAPGQHQAALGHRAQHAGVERDQRAGACRLAARFMTAGTEELAAAEHLRGVHQLDHLARVAVELAKAHHRPAAQHVCLVEGLAAAMHQGARRQLEQARRGGELGQLHGGQAGEQRHRGEAVTQRPALCGSRWRHAAPPSPSQSSPSASSRASQGARSAADTKLASRLLRAMQRSSARPRPSARAVST